MSVSSSENIPGTAGDVLEPVSETGISSSDPYKKEKIRLIKRIAHYPAGATLEQILNDIHGRGNFQTGGPEYQRARRFYNSKPQYFTVSKDGAGVLYVEPTLTLFDLINGGIIQNPREKPSQAGLDFCRNLLSSVKEINPKGRDLLEQNLREYLERINDLRIILEAEDPDTAPEYITLPYKTRFNDEGRISKQHAILSSELEVAGEMYDNAVLLTLTTDPKKFSSLLEMWEQINTNFNRLMSWLSTDSRLGYRPDYVKVLEATEKGYPHLHCIIFLEDESTRANGMPWLEDKNEISRYWNKYQARIIDTAPLVWEDDLPEGYDQNEGWVRWQEDGNHGGDLGGGRSAEEGGGQTAGQYLGKYLSAIYNGIRAQNAPRVLTDGGRDLPTDELEHQDKAAGWKVAMYWATRRKIRTESRDLRQAVEEELEDDLLEELTEIIKENKYRFVGAYPRKQIPTSIRRELVTFEDLSREPWEEKPPPDPPLGASDEAPISRQEHLKRMYPVRVWPLLEELVKD